MPRLLVLLSFLLLSACTGGADRRAFQPSERILIFSHTTGYRHDSIAAGIPALSALARQQGYTVFATESPDVFTPKSLESYDAIIFLSTTTDPRDPSSEWLTGSRAEALREFVRKGGGIAAIHAAADSHYHSPWYAALIGGQFDRHPPETPAGKLTVVAPDHPAMRTLPSPHVRNDEWYLIRNRDPKTTLLLALEAESIGEQGAWPISWTRTEGRGRIFYTALGHTRESYSDPYFLTHVRNGLAWVLKERRRIR